MKNSALFLLFTNPWVEVLLFSAIQLASVKRPVLILKCISAWYYHLTAGSHLPPENAGYFPISAFMAMISV